MEKTSESLVMMGYGYMTSSKVFYGANSLHTEIYLMVTVSLDGRSPGMFQGNSCQP